MGFPLNKKDEGGVISSETLNLTRITTMLAGALATATAVSGAAADSGIDWAGFSRGERLVLVVVAVAAIAVISCVDIIARAVAVAKSENSPIQILKVPQPAKLASASGAIDGFVMAVRPGQVMQVLFFSPDATPETAWKNLAEVRLYEKKP